MIFVVSFFTFLLIIFHIFCWSFHFEVHRHVVLVKVGRMVVVGFVFVAAASGHKEMVLNCIAPKIVCAGKKGQEMPKAQLFSYYGSPNLTRSGSGIIHTKIVRNQITLTPSDFAPSLFTHLMDPIFRSLLFW